MEPSKMRESGIIRTIVITLATCLVTACNSVPVADNPVIVPVETRADCGCNQLQQTSIFAMEAEISVFATEAEIKEIQARLILLGYPAGEIDGVVGDNTRDAIKAYQADHKLLTDGRPSTELLTHIKTDTVVKKVPTVSYPGL